MRYGLWAGKSELKINLDNKSEFELFHSFTFPNVYTYGDGDSFKREKIREAASRGFPNIGKEYKWWAFRIIVTSDDSKIKFDIDNVPKLIIDSFSGSQIERDDTKYKNLSLYPDDTVESVRILEVIGNIGTEKKTIIEIFGKL